MSNLELIDPNEAQNILNQPVKPKENQSPPDNQAILNQPLRGRKLDYSTQGRFTAPESLYWEYFSVEDTTTLSLADEDDLFPIILSVLNGLKNDKTFDISNMTLEEFMETLIFLKISYAEPVQSHLWMCDCQNKFPEEDRQTCSEEIDLTSLNFTSMEEADKKLREKFLAIFKDLTPEQFAEYLRTKYGKDVKTTPEKESEKIKVREPIGVKIGEDIYTFRFTRIGDVIEAQNLSNKKHGGKIRKIQSEKFSESMVENKQVREKKIKDVKKQISKDIVMYSRALSMMAKNGQELTTEQKFDEWRKFKLDALEDVNSYFNEVEFGLNTEKELTCSFCGATSKRFLQQEFNLLELLPLPRANSKSAIDRGRALHLIV